MGHFLDVAQQILQETQDPLSAKEIVGLAKTRGILHTTGQAPEEIMRSKLSTNILVRKEHSIFMRASKGRFALRVWNDRLNEYVADRFQKALLDEYIAVFPSKSLFNHIDGKGLHLTPMKNFQDLVTECSEMLRRKAEQDFQVIQLISVFIVRFGDQYLTYKRTKRLPEERLHGYYSIIFGGHFNLTDILPMFNVFSSEYSYLKPIRELQEEVRWPKTDHPAIRYKGLLYDDSRDVSRQHLGIVYDVFLQSNIYQIGEKGFLMDPRFETLSEIEKRINEFENWSVLIVEHEQKERNTILK